MSASQSNIGPAPAKLACFEAIRGLAAVAVLVGHFILGFYPGLYFRRGLGWDDFPIWVRALARFPGKCFWDGNLAVSIFFVLSGLVLSLGYFRNRSTPVLGVAAVRRYPRLMLPAAASILLAFLLLRTGAISSQAAVRFMNDLQGLPQEINHLADPGQTNIWLTNYYPFAPDFGVALREALWGAFTGVAGYNLVLWTMSLELTGSLLVYAFLALFGGLRNRWLIYVIGGTLLVLNGQVFLLDFLLGVALSDLWARNQRAGRRSLKLAPAVLLALGAVCFMPWKCVAALLVVGATAASPPLQERLSGRWLTLLGKVSFSLYLVHMPIFCSVGCGLFLVLCRDLGWPYAAGALTAALAALLTSLATAWIFYHAVDRPAMAISHWLDSFLLGAPSARRGDLSAVESSVTSSTCWIVASVGRPATRWPAAKEESGVSSVPFCG